MKASRKQFTLEVYCEYPGCDNPANHPAAWLLHEGSFEENRDGLSPQMFWARDFFADSLADASRKVKRLLKFYERSGIALSNRTPCSLFNWGSETKPAHGIGITK